MKHMLYAIIIIVVLSASSCTKTPSASSPLHDECNSIYYWKTVFHLDSADRAFIHRHHIRRVYLRMFDVIKNYEASGLDNLTVPNATVRVGDDDYGLIRDSMTAIEFIPVVYITLDALKAMKRHEGVMASNIVERVKNMCQYNELPNVSELQLDCDWTASTEASFFNLCDSVKQLISKLQLPWRLSSTIRLHQLARKAPPVDNGMLMVYNTGSFDNPDTRNSIIDADDVRPYLKYLSAYPLHLDIAYPTYSWQLLFRKRRFIGLINGVNTADSTHFTCSDDNSYQALLDFPHNDKVICAGDIVREERSSCNDIISVKEMIERHMSSRKHSNILYHLDLDNLSKYSCDEIDNIMATDL